VIGGRAVLSHRRRWRHAGQWQRVAQPLAGGDLSALLLDLSGLQFGNALLSALGIPDRDKIECFVRISRFSGRTEDAGVAAPPATSPLAAHVNLHTGALDYQISTEAKHFAIGSLPAPISITGPFKEPGALPDIRKLAVRGGAAAGLGVLFPPAAILPTIQFGVGDDHRCEALARRGK
jgi:hypothetical protein